MTTSNFLTLHSDTLYFLAHLFYAYMVPPIVGGELLICKSLDLNIRRIRVFTYIS